MTCKQDANRSKSKTGVKERSIRGLVHLLCPKLRRGEIILRQCNLNVTGGIAHARERGDLVAVGQLVGFLECRQCRVRLAAALLDDCQGAVTITLDQRIAGALALLDPDLQVLGGGFQVIPFVQQRTQLDVGGRNGRGLSSQLDHLPAQLGCPVQPAVHCLDHPQVGQRRHPGVMIARLLGGPIHFHECLLCLLEICRNSNKPDPA